MERQPLIFFDRTVLPATVHAIKKFARFIGSHPRNLVLVPNCTTGL
jgi:hypothetical protein